MLFFALLILLVSGLGLRALRDSLEQMDMTLIAQSFVRSISPLFFGIGFLSVWSLRIFVLTMQPARGIQQLPFTKKDWDNAIGVIILRSTLVLMTLLVLPLTLVLIGALKLGTVQTALLLGHAGALIICGTLLGLAMSGVVTLFWQKYITKSERLRTYAHYATFLAIILSGLVLFVKFVLLQISSADNSWWVIGSTFTKHYQAMVSNNAHNQIFAVLVLFLEITLATAMYLRVQKTKVTEYWQDGNGHVPKLTNRIPITSNKYVSTVSVTVKTVLRDGEVWLMTALTLIVPVLLGLAIHLSRKAQFVDLYAQLTWLLLPLGIANIAVSTRGKFGQSRLMIYQKPIRARLLVSAQLSVLGILSALVGLLFFVICGRLVGLSSTAAITLQFAAYSILSAFVAYDVGLLVGADKKGMGSKLVTVMLFFVALIPLISFDQWLRGKQIDVRIALSAAVLITLFLLALYAEEHGIAE
jgi:hypothetical protein